MSTQRTTVDLSVYPDLVVVYLGMKALTTGGAQTMASFGPGIAESAEVTGASEAELYES